MPGAHASVAETHAKDARYDAANKPRCPQIATPREAYLKHVIAGTLALTLATLTLQAKPAAAAEWPDKPVRVVVAYSAGGANDLLGRVFAEQLSKTFNQQFYVENRTGGGGLIGTEAVAHSAPDGYTLQIAGMPSHVLAPAMNKNANFDPIKDFTHIAYLGGPPNVFVVHPSLGVNTFAELLALMRSQPGGVQYVSPSIGSVGNMVAEYVADKEKVKLSHIVYRGGGSAIQDLIAGHVKVGSMTLSTTRTHILAGNLKPLAISSAQRVAEFPNVPTLVELGYTGLVVRTWYSLAGPAGLPRDIVDKLNAAVNKAMDLPEVRKHLESEMVQTQAMTPEQTTAFMQSEVDKWAPTARRIAAQAQK
jgi:tripartite-type tricarboxylate transporter receptor subunit TctC